jgi:hypothetical protein
MGQEGFNGFSTAEVHVLSEVMPQVLTALTALTAGLGGQHCTDPIHLTDVSDLFICESDFLPQAFRAFPRQQPMAFPHTATPTPTPPHHPLLPEARTDKVEITYSPFLESFKQKSSAKRFLSLRICIELN